MLRGLINDSKSAVSSLILKYLARASVAVPFLVAGGFAVAAITVTLINSFGYVTAYWLMAGGLVAIGVIAALVVSVKEHEEEVADQKAEQADTSGMAAEVAKQAPLAMLGALLTLPGGGSAALKTARILGRNIPLVLLAALIGVLLWPTQRSADAAAGEDVEPIEPVEPLTARLPPDGYDRPAPGAYTH